MLRMAQLDSKLAVLEVFPGSILKLHFERKVAGFDKRVSMLENITGLCIWLEK
jgi:hypothetical protein